MAGKRSDCQLIPNEEASLLLYVALHIFPGQALCCGVLCCGVLCYVVFC